MERKGRSFFVIFKERERETWVNILIQEGRIIQKISSSFLSVWFSSRSDVPLSSSVRAERCLLRLLVGIVNMNNHFSGERMMKSGGLEGCKRQYVQ